MMGELNFFFGLRIKQIEDGIFFNQSKYIKEMLKKFGLEDSIPTKMPMSTKIKLTKENEAESVDSSKYREDGIFFNQSKYIKEMLKKFGLEDSKPTKMPMSTEIKLTKENEAESVDSTKYRGEEVGVERSTELGSNDTEEMVNFLSAMDAANILISRVAAVSVSSIAAATTVGVPTVSGLVPTISAIFTTASVVTSYSRRPREISAKDKGKEKVAESNVPKKKKLQEQIDAQVAREIEEAFARDNQRLSGQLARDSKIARLHAKDELKMKIEGLDRRNERTVKHLHEYEQAAADLSIREKIEHFRGMTLKEIKEKFIPVWKQFEDFVPMSSKEEGERVKTNGLKLDHGSAKTMKTSEDVSEEDLKGMMQLVPVEEVYVEALLGGHTAVYQFFVDMLKHFDREDLHQLWAFVKETLSIRHATKDKEKELWVELKGLFEPDSEDQLWTHTQNLMHDPLDWKLYDTCGVHHLSTKDQEIFMLVERDYPLRRGLTIVMICNKLQVENYSQMANDLILKIHNIANSPR
nr:retrovirus-related Pol polyprotein from transposon TNT 1-94 [Tanacetum cinerariifolium]